MPLLRLGERVREGAHAEPPDFTLEPWRSKVDGEPDIDWMLPRLRKALGKKKDVFRKEGRDHYVYLA